MSVVIVKSFDSPEINIREVLRYAGCTSAAEDMNDLLFECISEANNALAYRVCYTVMPINDKISSKALDRNLSGCSSVILFAATVGLGVDRLINKYSRTQPSKAFDTLGTVCLHHKSL